MRKRDLERRLSELTSNLAFKNAKCEAQAEALRTQGEKFHRRCERLAERADTLAEANQRLVETIARLKVPVVQAATPTPDIPAILHEAMAGFAPPPTPPQTLSSTSNPDDIYGAQGAGLSLPWMPHSDWAPEALSDPFIGLDGRPVGIEVMGTIGKDIGHVAVATPMGDEVARADGQPMFRSDTP